MESNNRYETRLIEFYNVTGIPVSIVSNLDQFRLLRPKTNNEPAFKQHAQVLDRLIHEQKLPLATPLISTIYSVTFFSILRITEDVFIQVGPVASHEIDYSEYVTRLQESQPGEVLSFHIKLLQGAPTVDLNYFINTMILLTDLLCDRQITIENMIIGFSIYSDELRSHAKFFNRNTLSVDHLVLNDEIYRIVQTGNLAKLNEIQNRNHMSSLLYFQENDVYFLRMAYMFYGGILCHYAVLGGLSSDFVKGIFESFFKQFDDISKPESFWTILPQLSYTLCQEVNRHHNQEKSSPLIHTSIDFIHKNLYGDISIQDLEQVTNCSRRTILRHFKEYLHTTPSDYISEQKMDAARHLLKNSDLSIVDISTLLNYSSQSYFNRLFLQKNGCTPSQYRNNLT